MTPHRYLHDRLPRDEYNMFVTQFNLMHGETEKRIILTNACALVSYDIDPQILMNAMLTPLKSMRGVK